MFIIHGVVGGHVFDWKTKSELLVYVWNVSIILHVQFVFFLTVFTCFSWLSDTLNVEKACYRRTPSCHRLTTWEKAPPCGTVCLLCGPLSVSALRTITSTAGSIVSSRDPADWSLAITKLCVSLCRAAAGDASRVKSWSVGLSAVINAIQRL